MTGNVPAIPPGQARQFRRRDHLIHDVPEVTWPQRDMLPS